MTETQLYALYKSACGAAGRREDPSADSSWKACLLRFPKDEVEAALRSWWLDSAPVQGDLLREVKGATMPTAPELRARVLAAGEKAAARRKFIPCGRWFERDGKEYGCDNGTLRVRAADKLWDLTEEKCGCRLAWEKLQIEVTVA